MALMDPQASQVKYNAQDWSLFKMEHNKTYESREVESLRRAIFAMNKHKIEDFNSKFSDSYGFSLGLNHLADHGELDIASMNGFVVGEGEEDKLVNTPEAQKFLDDILNDDSIEVPDEVDWRKVPGRVSRVKNQGSCGSCWAFSAVGVLEGQEAVRNKNVTKVTELSEQNLVDCDRSVDMGCNGGIMKNALEFVKREGGIDDESSYPYEGRDGKCRFNKKRVVISDAGAAVLPEGDEQKLKEVVAKFGPVAVAIDASSLWFQFYRHGVYYNRFCRNKINQLDHGVLVVGYGTDPKKGDYWIVKNSWGPMYGESGYIRMARNRKNNCGIATAATIPTF